MMVFSAHSLLGGGGGCMPSQRPYIYIDSRRGPPVRLAWLEADCNMIGGGKTGYLKVPKCENFHRTDFFDFFTIKPLWVGNFMAKIKNSKF